MADATVVDQEHDEPARELRKEAFTMGLLDAARLVLAVFIGLVGYAVARGGGANVVRSVLYGVAILFVAGVVAVVKNVLTGH